MTHVLLASVLAVTLELGPAVAQKGPAPPTTDYVSQGTMIEGCLRAGSAAGEFIVTTASERLTVVAGQGIDLAPHVDHRVQLTGAIEKAQSGPVFLATDVKVLAVSCKA